MEIQETLESRIVDRGPAHRRSWPNVGPECLLRRRSDSTNAPEAERVFARERRPRIGDSKDVRLFLPRAAEQISQFTARIHSPLFHVASHVVGAKFCDCLVGSHRFRALASKVAECDGVRVWVACGCPPFVKCWKTLGGKRCV